MTILISSILPEVYLTLNVIFLLVYYGYYTISYKYKYLISIKLNVILPGLILVITTIMYVINVNNNMYMIDHLMYYTYHTNILKIFINTILILTILSSYSLAISYRITNFETHILLLTAQLGCLLTISSNNLLFIYLNIELITITVYLLIALPKRSTYNIEAGLKYFIIGAVSSGMFLLGISILYGCTGSLNLSDILLYMSSISTIESINSEVTIYLILSALFIINGLLFKIYSAPYHLWISDIYQGSTVNILYYISTVPSLVVFYVLIRLAEIYNQLFTLSRFILAFALLSVALGCLGALVQKKLKRLLAYSSITHVGYFLLGLSFYLEGSLLGLYTTIFYYIIYILNISSLLSNILQYNISKNKDQIYQANKINDFKNFMRQNKIQALIMTIILFSLAGVPPFTGFISKLILIYNVIVSNMNFFLLLFIIVTAVISSYYYLSIIKNIYFNNTTKFNYINYKLINTVISIILISFIFSFIVLMNNYNLIIFNIVLDYIIT